MLHPKLKLLFQDFDQARVRWCVLRLPREPDCREGDVDLVVARADMPMLRRTMVQQDFAQLPGWEPGSHFVNYDLATDQWLWLHVVTELSFGPYALLNTHTESVCLNRRRCEDSVVTLAPDDEFWVLLLHCLLDKQSIPVHYRLRLKQLSESATTDGELSRVIASVCPDDWNPEHILSCVLHEEWDQLEHFGPALLASWTDRSHIGRLRILFHRMRRLVIRFRNIARLRGLGVALLGPDGAGKSTLIAGLQESFILPVRSVYMGLTGGFLPYADRLRIPILVIPARLFIFWCRYLRAQYHQARGRLVIFDRYVYDYAVPTPYRLNWLKRLYRWIDGHAIPAPNLVLLLDAPGQVMYQRKGEYTAEMLEDWRQHFLALQHRVDSLEIVDTTRTIDQVRTDVTNRIWRRYAHRWKVRLNE